MTIGESIIPLAKKGNSPSPTKGGKGFVMGTNEKEMDICVVLDS